MKEINTYISLNRSSPNTLFRSLFANEHLIQRMSEHTAVSKTNFKNIEKGDEFPRRLCDPLPPVTAVLCYRWLAEGLHDKIKQYLGIRHPIEKSPAKNPL